MNQTTNKGSDMDRGNRETFEVIDDIMERKIGFGYYQKKALCFLCLIDFNDGLELILMSITLPIIKKEWSEQNIEEISSFMFQLLGSVFFFGNLLGALLTGPLSDRYGRRKVVLLNSLAYGLIALSFLFVESIGALFMLRLMYGFIYGITLPISTTFYSEITTTKMRGKGVIIINSAIAIGMLFAVAMSALVLDDPSSGNWRFLISISAIPALTLFYGTYYHLLESPRFLIVQKRLQEAADIMNLMIMTNLGDGGELITPVEIDSLEEWRSRKYDTPNSLQSEASDKSIQIHTYSFIYQARK